jgi:hypothetical protein
MRHNVRNLAHHIRGHGLEMVHVADVVAGMVPSLPSLPSLPVLPVLPSLPQKHRSSGSANRTDGVDQSDDTPHAGHHVVVELALLLRRVVEQRRQHDHLV